MIAYNHYYPRHNTLSFYGNYQLKQDLLTQLQYHYDHDQITKGQYWKNGKGCHVGCCIHSASHKDMSDFFGLPEWLCYLFDTTFEGLSNEDAMKFPLESIAAIPVGVDLEPVRHKLAIWRLLDSEHGIIRYSEDKCIIIAVAALHKKALVAEVSKDEWNTARTAADSAYYARSDSAYSARSAADYAAYSAADYAAYSAAYSAARAADYAAYSAAYSAARSAADSARSAADSADYAAYSAARSAADSARSTALCKYYQNETIQLLKLLQSA
jgi:hypothetical protein